LFENINTKEIVAVKFDPAEGNPNVLTECLFLKEFTPQLSKSPEYKLHSTIGGRRFLVM